MMPDSETVAKIRAMAMRDEGISDSEMQAFQDRKSGVPNPEALRAAMLEQMAQRDGGEAAIRAAMRPRKAKEAPKARARPAKEDLAAEEALAERNIAGMLAAQARPQQPFGPPGMVPAGAIGGAMQQAAPMPRRPLMAEPQAAPAAQAQEALAQMPPEQQQGLLQMLMQMLRPQQGPQPGQWGQPVPQLRNPAATPMP